MQKRLPTKKILIVEDDLFLLHSLASSLQSRNKRVYLASGLRSAMDKLANIHPDLLIVDRCLTDGDGLELVGYLRSVSDASRVLLLTQLGEATQKISGLRAGADDYLCKPFEKEELLLRVDNLLQLYRQPSDEALTVQQATISPQTGVVMAKGKQYHLRPREMQLLQHLARRKNQVVSRDGLIRAIWGTVAEPSVASLDVYIRRLRVALGESLEIRTVRGFGYMLPDQG